LKAYNFKNNEQIFTKFGLNQSNFIVVFIIIIIIIIIINPCFCCYVRWIVSHNCRDGSSEVN